jgi:hypothetical protein
VDAGLAIDFEGLGGALIPVCHDRTSRFLFQWVAMGCREIWYLRDVYAPGEFSVEGFSRGFRAVFLPRSGLLEQEATQGRNS